MFRGKPINTDPREAFVGRLMQERDERNLFHDYYRAVVQALYDQGVTNNVFCVNVDGVIAAWLLKLLWQPYRLGRARAGGAGERRVHHLPARPDGGLGGRDRGPPQPRPQHGHPHARLGAAVHRLTETP